MFDCALVDPPAALVAGWVLAEAAEDAAALRAGIERLDAGQPAMSTDGLWALLRRVEARDLDHPDLVPVGQEHLVDRMRGWAIVTAHTQARTLTQIADLAEHREVAPVERLLDPNRPGATADAAGHELAWLEFLPIEVGLALKVGRRTAELLVDDAVTLTQQLPDTFRALEAGRIDHATARAIGQETRCISPAARIRVEARALTRAAHGRASAAQVRAYTRREAVKADPASAADRAEAAKNDIGATRTPLVDGVGDLVTTLAADDLANVWATLTDHAHELQRTGDPRPLSTLRAAALVDMITTPWLHTHPTTGTQTPVDPTRTCHHGNHHTATTSEPGSRGQRWKVDVIVNLSTLLGLDDDPATLVGHGTITADTARALAADGTWRRLVTDPLTGTVIERSTTRYRPGAALADHITARDQHCSLPGCHKPAHHCDLDHRTPHNRGGPTDEHNLWPLCRNHHRCKHSPGWNFDRDPETLITTVTTPTGHTYTTGPPTPWD